MDVAEWLRNSRTWAKLAGLTLVLSALFSFDFERLSPAAGFLENPVGWVLLALTASVLFGAFTAVSCWSGWRQWSAIFLVFYGVPYVLTVAEAPYIPAVLPQARVIDLLVDGAIIAGIFALVTVVAFGRSVAGTSQPPARLAMPGREWIWKFAAGGAIYLALFFVFGAAIYSPLAKAMDPSGYTAEQGAIPAAGLALVFPIEFVRGLGFIAFALPAVMALPYAWKRTGLGIALLIGVPESAMILLSTSLAAGLIPAHFVEVLGANLIFGFAMVWLLNHPDRLSLVHLPGPARLGGVA